jgi:AraC-like DNA-binding protein
MDEIWLPIKNYDKYFVSNFGRIRSYKNKDSIILKTRANKKGYLYVNLCVNGKYKTHLVHSLVASHFLNRRNMDLQVNHINGNKINNILSNLEYISRNENMKHAKDNNLVCRREENGRHKLREIDVRLIRYKHDKGLGYKKISKQIGVSSTTVMRIIKNKYWIENI